MTIYLNFVMWSFAVEQIFGLYLNVTKCFILKDNVICKLFGN